MSVTMEGLYGAMNNLSQTCSSILPRAMQSLESKLDKTDKSNATLSENILNLKQALDDMKIITNAISYNTTIEAIKLLMANNPDEEDVKGYMKIIRMIYEHEIRKYSTTTQKEPISLANPKPLSATDIPIR